MNSLRSLILNPNFDDMFTWSLSDMHFKGLHSLVLSGEPGHLRRFFFATGGLKPGELALHNHKYSTRITAMTSGIMHHFAVQPEDPSSPEGGMSSQVRRLYGHADESNDEVLYEAAFELSSTVHPRGSSLYLDRHSFHSMSCEPGSVWAVEENPYGEKGREFSEFIGPPIKCLQPQVMTNKMRSELHHKLLRLTEDMGYDG